MCSSHDERFAEQYQLAIEMSIVDFHGSDVLDRLAAVHWDATTLRSGVPRPAWTVLRRAVLDFRTARRGPGPPSSPVGSRRLSGFPGSSGRHSYSRIRIGPGYHDFLIRIDLMSVQIPTTPGVLDGPRSRRFPRAPGRIPWAWVEVTRSAGCPTELETSGMASTRRCTAMCRRLCIILHHHFSVFQVDFQNRYLLLA